MNNGALKFKVIMPDWDDISLFEIVASSDDWQASLRFWGYADFVKNFAKQLISFSGQKNDSAVYKIGNELLIRAYCYDGAGGHPAIEIVINNNLEEPELRTARFSLLSEVSQINVLGKLLSGWDPKIETEIVWETNL